MFFQTKMIIDVITSLYSIRAVYWLQKSILFIYFLPLNVQYIINARSISSYIYILNPERLTESTIIHNVKAGIIYKLMLILYGVVQFV